MELELDRVRAFLLDLDGTLYQGERALPGAPKFVAALRAHGCPIRFVTNTTSRCRATLAARLARLGIMAEEEEIFGPPYAAARYLQARGVTRVYLLVQEDARQEFTGVAHVEEDAEFVVVGDLGEEWSFQRLNRAFRLLMEGAELIALGNSRYWLAPDGLRLDAGPFVAALEFATGKEPLVLGKPAPVFFRLAIEDLGMVPEQVAMVGDDVEVDVAGAQRAGLMGILVRTGKFRPEDLEGPVKPDWVVDSVADLTRGLGEEAASSPSRPFHDR